MTISDSSHSSPSIAASMDRPWATSAVTMVRFATPSTARSSACLRVGSRPFRAPALVGVGIQGHQRNQPQRRMADCRGIHGDLKHGFRAGAGAQRAGDAGDFPRRKVSGRRQGHRHGGRMQQGVCGASHGETPERAGAGRPDDHQVRLELGHRLEQSLGHGIREPDVRSRSHRGGDQRQCAVHPLLRGLQLEVLVDALGVGERIPGRGPANDVDKLDFGMHGGSQRLGEDQCQGNGFASALVLGAPDYILHSVGLSWGKWLPFSGRAKRAAHPYLSVIQGQTGTATSM